MRMFILLTCQITSLLYHCIKKRLICLFQGHIHLVGDDEVLLKISKNLHTYHQNSHLYNVRFTHNKVNVRRLYHAVEATKSLEPDLLFPSQSTQRRLIDRAKFMPFTCGLNSE